MNASANSIHEKIELARKELLDLGLRNPLLNYRSLRSRGLEVINEQSAEIYRILVAVGKSMTFLPSTEDEEPGVLFDPTESRADNQLPSNYADLKLQTALPSTKLHSRLLATYYTARTFIEEQGVNTLFLTLGMLKWFESDDSPEVLQAPLVLIPVELERSNARERFHLHYTDDEIGENLSLMAKMKEDFAINLPALPEIEDFKVQDYFRAVSRSILSQPKWSVDENAICLGFFSFSKFLMFRDLDSTNWPEGRKPVEHPIINALLLDGFKETPASVCDEEKIDEHVSSLESYQVVDADSSQIVALLEGNEGRNLVIQGPPGTGKSQTITNLIAEALGRGKTILFVAEKMAALEVVKRRLDNIGLGVACLELHSQKTNKKNLLKELSNTLELGKPQAKQVESELNLLGDIRQRLNDYCAAVNSPIGNSGIRPYFAYGEVIRLQKLMKNVDPPNIESSRCLLWSDVEFKKKRFILEELQALLKTMGVPIKHSFWGSQLKVFLPIDKDRLIRNMSLAKKSTQSLRESGSMLAATLLLHSPQTLPQAERHLTAGQFIKTAPPLSGINLNHKDWRAKSAELKQVLTAGTRYSELHHAYDSILKADAWGKNPRELKEILSAQGSKWWRFLSKKFRSAQRASKDLCKGIPLKNTPQLIQILDAILQETNQLGILRQHDGLASELFGSQWFQEKSDWKYLTTVSDWIINLNRHIDSGKLPGELLGVLIAGFSSDALLCQIEGLANDKQKFIENMGTVADLLKLDEKVCFNSALKDQEYARIESVLDLWLNNIESLHSMVSFNNHIKVCRSEDLHDFIELANFWEAAGQHLTDIFLRDRYEKLISKAFQERPALARFDGDSHQQLIKNFCRLDKLSFEYNRARLMLVHWSKLPNYEAGGQLGILKREFEKRARHLPIRQLILKSGTAIQAIKPVFMLSPLSIAAFLAPGSVSFDLIIFDEASQVKPVDAFGAIMRGKQTIVVGDKEQLPPTNFFDTLTVGDESDENENIRNMPSILGLFSAKGASSRMLKWHYRSRHESLIAVSNHLFYDDKLVVFPSPLNTDERLGLFFHHLPETVYDRGKTRTNKEEAMKVAEAVMRHAREWPNLTLGVAAFSDKQRESIQQCMELLRREDPSCESFFNLNLLEPFFIKNLENVQGDERDVIFISIGYGRTAEGFVSMNFGPLNNDGGERRLNVLITRARMRCEVFTNLTSDDLDLSRSSTLGVRALKSFLKYAQHRNLDVPMSVGREPDSVFEEMVCSELKSLGYNMEQQVGSGGFFIDLAVVDKEQPGRYILGIECDGATYHRARSARDRDRLRQQVLEGLGWQIHRIWSTDWFHNPARELERVVEAIEVGCILKGRQNRPKTSEIQKEFVRAQDQQQQSANHEIPAYRFADLTILFQGQENSEITAGTISSWIAAVVEVESPVHFQEVFRRIADSAGIHRIGNRIEKALKLGVSQGSRIGAFRKKGDFLWSNDIDQPNLRDRSNFPSSSKRLEFVAPEEIALAIKLVIKRAYGMKRDDVPPAVSRIIGFQRTTDEMRSSINVIIEGLLKTGRLCLKNEHLQNSDA